MRRNEMRMILIVGCVATALSVPALAARGESLAAFGRRCIPAGCFAPPSNTPGIATPPRKPRAAGAPVLGRRALPAGRIVALGATPDLHHGLPAAAATCESLASLTLPDTTIT